MNGEYLVIEVKANDGIPKLLPKGLPKTEIDLSEKQGTGILKILRELKKKCFIVYFYRCLTEQIS